MAHELSEPLRRFLDVAQVQLQWHLHYVFNLPTVGSSDGTDSIPELVSDSDSEHEWEQLNLHGHAHKVKGG